MASVLCSPKFLLFFFVISAIPLGFLISLERSISSTHVYRYRSHGWFRECAKWDDDHRRFLVSYVEGGVGQIPLPEFHDSGAILEERTVIKDADVAGNSSAGILIDRQRNRLLVVYTNLFGNFGALAAYDLSTWQRLFLSHLNRPGDEETLADDVAIDHDGNAYVTDAKGNKIWKVGVNGELLSTIRSPLFNHKEKRWYQFLVGLNGIVYHPNGFLLVVHTSSGALYKIDTKTEEVKLVKVIGRGSLMFGDGLELVSATELVVAAGMPSARMVESRDGWETAEVVGKFSGPLHRLTTAATVKDGKVYLNHMIGFGFPNRKHVLMEAVFKKI